jgi:hypothetical protein
VAEITRVGDSVGDGDDVDGEGDGAELLLEVLVKMLMMSDGGDECDCVGNGQGGGDDNAVKGVVEGDGDGRW